MSDIDLKLCDLLEFSKMCAPEYNMPELSDRILVFDVMQDGWQTSSVLNSVSSHKPCLGTAASTFVYPSSNEDQSLATSERFRSEEIKEDTTSSIDIIESPDVETGRDLGPQSENESNDNKKLACDQDTKANDVTDTTTSLNLAEAEISEAEKPVLNVSLKHFDEPIRQHKIFVHSFWLSVQSQYFRSLFYSSGMKENQEKEVHVKVSESEENAHLIIVEALYRADVLNDRTAEELLAVLELANKYDLKFVFKKCKYVLCKSANTFEICTQIMHVIKIKHNMNDVEELVATIGLVLAKEFSPLDEYWQSEKFVKLSEPSLKCLLSKDDLIVQSENTVFCALMYWMEQNKIDPAGLVETNDLLSSVRFKLVTIDYLYNVVRNHSIASEMPMVKELFLDGMIYHAIPPNQKKLLEEQPVLRKQAEKITQYTFIVRKDEFEAAKKTGKSVCSDEFWACGYKMSLSLTRHVVFSSEICPELNIKGLNKESLVLLKFSVGKTAGQYNSWSTETFTLDSCRKTYPHMYIREFGDDEKCNLYVAVKPS